MCMTATNRDEATATGALNRPFDPKHEGQDQIVTASRMTMTAGPAPSSAPSAPPPQASPRPDRSPRRPPARPPTASTTNRQAYGLFRDSSCTCCFFFFPPSSVAARPCSNSATPAVLSPVARQPQPRHTPPPANDNQRHPRQRSPSPSNHRIRRRRLKEREKAISKERRTCTNGELSTSGSTSGKPARVRHCLRSRLPRVPATTATNSRGGASHAFEGTSSRCSRCCGTEPLDTPNTDIPLHITCHPSAVPRSFLRCDRMPLGSRHSASRRLPLKSDCELVFYEEPEPP